MSARLVSLWLACALLLSACQVPAANTPAATTAATPRATRDPRAGNPSPAPAIPATDTPRAWPVAPTLTARPPAQRPQHSLVATLDDAAHRLVVRQTLAYPNTAGVTLSDLVLEVMPDATPGVLTLERFAVDGAAATPERSGARWRVALAQPLAPDAWARLDIAYSVDLQPIPPSAADAAGGLGWTSRQTNLGSWYPVVAAYRAGEWLVHPPSAVGETQALEAADYNVELTVVGLPGAVVAATAPGQPEPLGSATRWRFTATSVRSFALSVSAEFEVTEARAGGVAVRAYTFPEHRAAGAAVLQAVTRAVGVYGHAFGEYPYPQLSVVEGDFLDGLEFAGMFFLGYTYYAGYDGTPRNWVTTIAVHEAAHQWWYGLVGNDQALEPWLDESFATYSELVFYQAAYPDLERWWWDFRIYQFVPVGDVDSTVYDLPQFRPYVDAVYLRGAVFLNDLRATLGDESFFAFLRLYVALYRGRIATAADFWETLGPLPEAATLRHTYFRNPGPPL